MQKCNVVSSCPWCFPRPGSELITSKVWAEVLGVSTGLTAVLLPKSHMKVEKLEYNIMELMIKTSKCVVLGVLCFVSKLEVLEGLKCHTPPVEVTFRESVRFIFIVVSSFTIRVNFAAGLKYILPNGRFAASIRTPFWLLDPCRPFVHGFSIRPSTLIV